MKKTLISLVGVLSLFVFVFMSTPSHAALCFLCGSGSSNGCKQCRSRSGKDTQKDRKVCKNLGCKISGTGSCSSAANVKVCSVKKDGPTMAKASSRYFIY